MISSRQYICIYGVTGQTSGKRDQSLRQGRFLLPDTFHEKQKKHRDIADHQLPCPAQSREKRQYKERCREQELFLFLCRTADMEQQRYAGKGDRHIRYVGQAIQHIIGIFPRNRQKQKHQHQRIHLFDPRLYTEIKTAQCKDQKQSHTGKDTGSGITPGQGQKQGVEQLIVQYAQFRGIVPVRRDDTMLLRKDLRKQHLACHPGIKQFSDMQCIKDHP